MENLNYDQIWDKYSIEIEVFCDSLINNRTRSFLITCKCFNALKIKFHDFPSKENMKAFLFELAIQECKKYIKRATDPIFNSQLN